MEEYSVGIIKPDGMRHRSEILSIIKKKGLKIVSQKIVHLDKQSLTELYKEHINDDFFQSFCNFMMSGECLAFIVKGRNAIKVLDKLVGATNPHEAKPGTLRKKFGTNVKENAIHCSDNEKHFRRELKILFPEFTLEKPSVTRDKPSGFLFYTKTKEK
jgi:nucleoside-diphosphate kinase